MWIQRIYTLAILVGSIILANRDISHAGEIWMASDSKDQGSVNWSKVGAIVNLPMMDEEGKLVLHQTKFYIATSSLLRSHDADASGKLYQHAHFKDEYADIGRANRYWDAMFGVPGMASRTQDATVKTNGYNYVLKTFLSQDSFNFWLDKNLGASDEAIKAALASDQGEGNPRPSTVVKDPPGSAAKEGKDAKTPSNPLSVTVSETSWKSGPSGVYKSKDSRQQVAILKKSK